MWISWAALYSFWALALLSIGRASGAVVVATGRTIPVYPLLATVVVVFVTVIVTYASTRFRTTAEPSLVVLAAVAIDCDRDAPHGQHHSRSATIGSDGT